MDQTQEHRETPESENTLANILELARRSQTLHPSRTLCRAIVKHVLSTTATTMSLGALIVSTAKASQPQSALQVARYLFANSLINYSLAQQTIDEYTGERISYLYWHLFERSRTTHSVNNHRELLVECTTLVYTIATVMGLALLEPGLGWQYNMPTVTLLSYHSISTALNHHYAQLKDRVQLTGQLKLRVSHSIRALANHLIQLEEVPDAIVTLAQSMRDEQHHWLAELDLYLQEHPDVHLYQKESTLDQVATIILTSSALVLSALSCAGVFSTITNEIEKAYFRIPILSPLIATIPTSAVFALIAPTSIRAANYYLWDAPAELVRHRSLSKMPMTITTRLMPIPKIISKTLLYSTITGVSWQYLASSIFDSTRSVMISDSIRTVLGIMALISSTLFMGEYGEWLIDYCLIGFANKCSNDNRNPKFQIYAALNQAADQIDNHMQAAEFISASNQCTSGFPTFFERCIGSSNSERTRLLPNTSMSVPDIEMGVADHTQRHGINDEFAPSDNFNHTQNAADCADYTSYLSQRIRNISTWCW